MLLNNIHLFKTVILATKDCLCFFRKILTASLKTRYSDLPIELVVFHLFTNCNSIHDLYECLTNISARTANK